MYLPSTTSIIPAFKSLINSNPEIHFHFVGNQAPNFEEYWSPIMKSIPKNVTVWGERSDAKTFMMAARSIWPNPGGRRSARPA